MDRSVDMGVGAANKTDMQMPGRYTHAHTDAVADRAAHSQDRRTAFGKDADTSVNTCVSAGKDTDVDMGRWTLI
eukprot:15478997-Alexandrium_andersonii.AAC.1